MNRCIYRSGDVTGLWESLGLSCVCVCSANGKQRGFERGTYLAMSRVFPDHVSVATSGRVRRRDAPTEEDACPFDHALQSAFSRYSLL